MNPIFPKLHKILSSLVLVLLLSASARSTFSNTIFVSPTGTDEGGNGTEALPFGTVQRGIDTAVDGDTVLVLPGTLSGVGNRDIRFLGKSITLQSRDGADTTFLDGGGAKPLLVFLAGDPDSIRVAGFSLFNGRAPLVTLPSGSVVGEGGGILCRDASPSIEDCIIFSNKSNGSSHLDNATAGQLGDSGYGGGAYCENSAAHFLRCRFENNLAIGGASGRTPFGGQYPSGPGEGGGLCVAGASSVLVQHCAFRDNIARGGPGNYGGNTGRAHGAGVRLLGGTLTLEDSVVEQNTADCGVPFQGIYSSKGVGVSVSGGNLIIDRCAIQNNAMDFEYFSHFGGGGLFVESAQATIRDCNITGNTIGNGPSSGYGGGVAIEAGAGPIVFERVLIAGNTAHTEGGGLYCDPGAAAQVQLTNCTLSDNAVVYSGGTEISALSGDLALNFTTVADGGTFAPLKILAGASLSLASCIIQSAPGVAALSGASNSLGHNVVSDPGFFSVAANDLIGIDPLLAPLAANGGPAQTRALLDGSPAIDFAVADALPATDQRGVARPFDGSGDGSAQADAGAFELDHISTITVPVYTPRDTPSPTTTPTASPSPTLSPTPTPAPDCFASGGAASTFNGTNRFRGNVYTAATAQKIAEISVRLQIGAAAQGSLWFQVLRSETLSGNYTPVFAKELPVIGTGGPGIYSSGPIQTAFDDGYYYAIGVGWGNLNVTHYNEPATLPADWGKGQVIKAAIINNVTPPLTAPVDPGPSDIVLTQMEFCTFEYDRPAHPGEIQAYLLGGPPSIHPMDLNNDGQIDIADVVEAINP